MKQLPTAEDILDKKFKMESFEHDTKVFMYDALNAMIEFAKLHVQAALESAAENGKVYIYFPTQNSVPELLVNKESILNAYPLDNIK